MGSAMPHRRSYLRLFSWVAAAALLVAGLAAIQPARSAAAARSGPLAHPVLTASHAPLAMLASAPSVPVGTGPVRGGNVPDVQLDRPAAGAGQCGIGESAGAQHRPGPARHRGQR